LFSCPTYAEVGHYYLRGGKMKTKILIGMGFLIMCIFMASVAMAQEPIVIWGWAHNGDIVQVNTSDDVYFSVRWGACTKGLVTAWSKRAYVVYTIDGDPVTSSKKETRSYWSKPLPLDDHWGIPFCINNSDVIWMAYWDYPVDLPVGLYDVTFEYGIDPPFSDGIDMDGDGRPDKNGHLFSTEFQLEVIEAP
jgi:hypothetical protein